MDLHIGYESAPPAKLKQIDGADEKVRSAGLSPNLFSKPTSTKKKPKDPTICDTKEKSSTC